MDYAKATADEITQHASDIGAARRAQFADKGDFTIGIAELNAEAAVLTTAVEALCRERDRLGGLVADLVSKLAAAQQAAARRKWHGIECNADGDWTVCVDGVGDDIACMMMPDGEGGYELSAIRPATADGWISVDDIDRNWLQDTAEQALKGNFATMQAEADK